MHRGIIMNSIISAILAVIMTVMMSGCDSSNNGMRDISTMDVVREMGYGINLGNTLESCGDWINGFSPSSYEKAW